MTEQLKEVGVYNRFGYLPETRAALDVGAACMRSRARS